MRRDQQDVPLRIFERDGWWYINRLRGTGLRFKSKEEAEAYINRPGCGNPNCGHGRPVQPPVIPSGDCFPAPVDFTRKNG